MRRISRGRRGRTTPPPATRSPGGRRRRRGWSGGNLLRKRRRGGGRNLNHQKVSLFYVFMGLSVKDYEKTLLPYYS